ncbi:MAG TPA: nitrite reductase large subunit NirB [Armatimonadota bacterium]
MQYQERLVVIGNGMVGAKTLEEILARDRGRFSITVFGEEPHGCYNRILLSNVLNGAQSEDEVFTHTPAWYHQNDITLRAGVRVSSIDRERKVVVAEDGTEEPFDKLVIATGSRPFVPPMEGADKAGVFLFRTLADCREIAGYAKECRKAAVIGGGLLGLEAARGLATHGVEVSVVEVAPHLMVQQLDAEGAGVLQGVLEGMGLRILTGRATTRLVGNGRVQGLEFRDGETLDADMVVISCGIRANSEIARECGLEVDRGIKVDDQMRTSDESIFAVGECAQHRGVVYGLVAPLYEQAQVLADVLTGISPHSLYLGSKLATKLKVMGVELLSLGRLSDVAEDDEVVSYLEPRAGVYKKLVVRGGKLHAGCLLGESRNSGSLMDLFARDADVPDSRSVLLFPRQESGAGGIEDLPNEALICSCHQVTKKKLLSALDAGRCSVSTLGACTKAGTGCGGCKPLLQELIEAYAGGTPSDPADDWYVPGVPLSKPELMEEIRRRGLKSVSAVFRELAGGAEDPASKMGLASLLKAIWHEEYEDERDARFINDRVHANIQKDATYSVVPRIFGGVTSPEELRRIADAAEKFGAKMVKITGGQRIDLLGIRREDLPAIWDDLGMPSGHAYTKAMRTCKTCVGTEFCRYGVGDSTALGIRIERRFQGIEFPHKVKLAASGCPRNCAEATVKDIGVVAVDGGWEVYIGGAAGSRVRAGDLLCKVETPDEVLRVMGRFMQYYREHGKWMERTAAFVERVGIGLLRSVLVDDSEGICDRLDEEIQRAVDAYVDPWDEAGKPYHQTQFAGELEAAR